MYYRSCPRSLFTALFVLLAAAGSPLRAQSFTSPYVTSTMDGSYNWFEQGANPADPLTGLPHAGIIYGISDPQSTFLLQPYTANNVLLLSSAHSPSSGTLTLQQPTNGISIAFAVASSPFIPSTLDLTLHFALGAPDFTTKIEVPDWVIGAGPVVADGGGWAGVGPNGIQFEPDGTYLGTAPRILESVVDLPPVVSGYPLTSIDVTAEKNGIVDNTHTAIFGISMTSQSNYSAVQLTPSSFNQDIVVEAAAGAVPEPTAPALLSTFASLLLRRRRRILQ